LTHILNGLIHIQTFTASQVKCPMEWMDDDTIASRCIVISIHSID
jgi:hypothetical protein